jgi:hypothetical protein
MTSVILNKALGLKTCKQTAQAVNSVIASPTDIPGMAFPVFTGRLYIVKWYCIFQTAATTTGGGFTTSGPAMTNSAWYCQITQGGSGVDLFYEQQTSNAMTALVAASVIAQDTDYIAVLEGFFKPSADGTIQLRARTEVDGSAMTVQNRGVGYLIDAG